MAEQSKDDLAKALEALSTGTDASDHHEEAHVDASHPGVTPDRPASPLTAQQVTRPGPAGPVPSLATRNGASVAARSLELKRTMIPILLTLGVILPAGGIACLLMGDESPLRDQILLPLMMIVIGVLIVAAALLTMLQVRHALTAKPAR